MTMAILIAGNIYKQGQIVIDWMPGRSSCAQSKGARGNSGAGKTKGMMLPGLYRANPMVQ